MLDGVRTPMVDYCGALGHVSPTDLGIKAAREVLKRAGVPADHIGSVITGNMAPGDFDQFFLPRHIGLYAGVPVDVPAHDGAAHLRHRLRAVPPGRRADPGRPVRAWRWWWAPRA